MTFKMWLVGTAGFLQLAALSGSTQAAPLAGAAKELTQAASTENHIKKAQYRICVTEGGGRQCRNVEIYGPGGSTVQGVYGYQPQAPIGYGYLPPQGPIGYGYQAPVPGMDAYPLVGYGYLPPAYRYEPGYSDTFVNPDLYPTGSTPWWSSMDKLGRGGHQD